MGRPQNSMFDTDKAAEASKDRGNALFARGRHADALACYTEAIALSSADEVPPGGTEDEQRELAYRRAVYYSNRSNCCFELGNYKGAAGDARSCLGLLADADADTEKVRGDGGDEKVSRLRRKNLYRLARASFYGGTRPIGEELRDWRADVVVPLKAAAAQGDDDAASRPAKRMIRQVELYERLCSDSPPVRKPRPPIHRANLRSPVCEYFAYGHDTPTSALAEGWPDERGNSTPIVGAIDLVTGLPKADDEGRKEIAVLFGGAGDSRHIMATVIDAWHQLKKLPVNERKSFRIHLTMNDFQPASLARAVLFYIVLERLGRFSVPPWSSASDPEARRLATLMQYLFFGYVMPRTVREDLRRVLAEAASHRTSESFEGAYPWMYVTRDAWEKIRSILLVWKDASGFPSVSSALGKFYAAERASNLQDMYGTDPKAMDQMHERRQASAQQQREEQLKWVEGIQSVNDLPRDVVEMCRERSGDKDINNDLVRSFKAYMRKEINEMSDEEINKMEAGKVTVGLVLDQEFIIATNCILPPSHMQDPESTIFKEIRQREQGPDRQNALFRKAIKLIQSTWEVNPTFFDPTFHMIFFEKQPCTTVFNPVRDVMEKFLNDDLLEKTPTNEKPWCESDFFCCASCFFWNVGFALVNLLKSNTIRLEISVESVTDLCRGIQDRPYLRRASSLPSMFYRIFVSNIPDYIGMLSFFTEVMPALHKPTDKIPTFMQADVLFNTGIWKDYAHYIFSSTGILSLQETTDLLGMKYIGENSCWVNFNRWTWGQGSGKPLARREDITVWLERLFLLIVLPPKRHASWGSCVEQCPSNVALFLQVCCLCVQLGYPSRWVNSILDSLLSASLNSRGLKTSAGVISESPSKFQLEGKPKRIDISAFSLDLKIQVALWMNRHSLEICPLSVATLPLEPVYRYSLGGMVLVVKGDSSQCTHIGGKPSTFMLGALLSKERPAAYDQNSAFDLMFPVGMESLNEPIREAVIVKGSGLGQVLSCLHFELDFKDQLKHSLSFWMTEKTFHEFSSFYLSLIRTDTWCHVGGSAVQLRDAVKCQ